MIAYIARRWASIHALRSATILAVDIVATFVALHAALSLRLELPAGALLRPAARLALPLVGIRLIATGAARLHRWSFRMAGLSDLVRLLAAVLASSVAFALFFGAVSPLALPASVYALEFFLATTVMAGARFAPQIVGHWYSDQQAKRTAAPTIIVGAGHAGDLLARDLRRSSERSYFVVGFVDDDPARLGTRVDGKPVLGRIDDLPALIARHEIGAVLLAATHLSAARIREMLSTCSRSKASFKIIPASFSNMQDRISAAMLHDLSPEDLLPRDAVAFDPEEIRALVRGRRALVTGAGGSIGGEICRQLAAHGAAQVVMVDVNENALYLGARALQHDFPAVRVHAEVADIREASRLAFLGNLYRPEYVFHAAAHKHVPLMEDAPEEAVKNNVFGTLNAARMADACGASRFVLISTDKAVKPTSVMGASKRIAEYVVRDLARRSRTQMKAVRFGNVLGSAGSVIPLFKQQIERGGPVTVTHPDCTRYFMTIPEAVGLVLIAGLSPGDGELCVLEMGEPIKIADLARNLITMAGYVPDEEIPIVFTGLRPGEKLFEELFTDEEEQTHAVRNRVKVAVSPPPPGDLERRLAELRRLADAGDREALLGFIGKMVPSYRRTPAQAPPAPTPAPGELAPVLPLRGGGGRARVA